LSFEESNLTDFSPVPLTLEGSFVLHQFFRFDWKPGGPALHASIDKASSVCYLLEQQNPESWQTLHGNTAEQDLRK
jgi:hypothetical protein